MEIYKNKSPSYTIIGKGKDMSNKFISPGPGQYDGQLKQSNSGFSMPKSRKDIKTQNNYVPGPGQYKYNDGLSRPKSSAFSFISSKKNTSFIQNNDVPGPGSYSNNSNIGNKGYSIGKSSKGLSYVQNDNKYYNNVGPGKYDIDGKFNNKSNQGGVKIGNQKRDFHYDSTISPGPAQYSQFNQTSKGGYSFGKSLKNLNSSIGSDSGIYSLNTTSPGPGKYNQYSVFDKSKGGYSFSKSINHNKVASTPGPGHYNDDYSKIKPNHPNVFIGSSGNNSTIISGINSNPGPGLQPR